jgi:UDP-N-acetylmuramate: L-alanyl-gamma-D-glutamyl-meso-diaminopimelate ligase
MTPPDDNPGKRIHILGICGTFMGGLALLARELGLAVSGSDRGIYPPMSDQLAAAGIVLTEGYEAEQLDFSPDEVVVGNAMTRGHGVVERLLDEEWPLVSGPDWLYRHVLRNRQVLAVAGTHGKTTTSSMLAWILEAAGQAPGFLIGGVPMNFGVSARLGSGPFVVEADEYDSAFFDKRSKFIHYRPRVLVLNNLEFDHADIFRDLDDVSRQFHHLVRVMPTTGQIVCASPDDALDELLSRGCWTPLTRFGIDTGDWQARLDTADGSAFTVRDPAGDEHPVRWELIGAHNVRNALAAVAAATAAGAAPAQACTALEKFAPPRRRLELKHTWRGARIYDDFAHHPTAIRATLEALRAAVGDARILAILDPASNTMRMGVHRDTLAPALDAADRVLLHEPPGTDYSLVAVGARVRAPTTVHDHVSDIVAALSAEIGPGDHVLVMSNGGFGGIHEKLITALEESVT